MRMFSVYLFRIFSDDTKIFICRIKSIGNTIVAYHYHIFEKRMAGSISCKISERLYFPYSS